MLALEAATALARRIRDGELSSRELLAVYTERIERLNPALNAVVATDLDRAERTAKALDDRAARGDWAGPLHGLPCTVKDALDTEGIATTGGAVELAGRVPPADAPAVARVRAAGAVVLGKTNLSRWSGDFQAANALFGATNNPYDPARTPGGSSGGAAAAVAAGLCAFDIGTDLAGSIRIPSSFCGTAGHKPTHGIVSERGNVTHPDGGVALTDMTVVGPLARHVDDLDLLMDVLAGPEYPDEGWSLRLPHPPSRALRIAVHAREPGFPLAGFVGSAVDRAAAALAGDGADVAPADLPVTFGETLDTFVPLALAATSLAGDTESGMDRSLDSHTAWLRADIARAGLARRWSAWFERCDALLLPAWPAAAHPHDPTPFAERTVDVDGEPQPLLVASAWLTVVGLVGLPSTVVRVGESADGLPVGIQVVAARNRDRTALAVARRLEQLLGGYRPPVLAATPPR